MVKNTGGGNHKNRARKHQIAPVSKKTRLPTDDLEVFGVATKMLGNGRFMANIISGSHKGFECIGIIRGKFSGPKKHQNTVAPGVLVLLGERSWTASDTKMKNFCDLLHVYSNICADNLCSDNVISRADLAVVQTRNIPMIDDFQFATTDEIEAIAFLDSHSGSSNLANTGGNITIDRIDMGGEEDIDIDDI